MYKLIQYAVIFEPFETEGLEYVKQGCGAMWTDQSPEGFDTHEEAQKGQVEYWTGGAVWIMMM